MKRCLAVVAAVFTLLLPIFLFSSAQLTIVRAATCSTQTGVGFTTAAVNVAVNTGDTVSATANFGGILASVTIAFPGGGFVVGTLSASGTASSAGTATVTFTDSFSPIFNYSVTVCSSSSIGTGSGANNPPKPVFDDDRLNNWDPFGTSALYCRGGSLQVYVPAEPKWKLALAASPAELAAVPKNPAQNTVIKSGNGATLLRLQNGSLQIDTPALEPSKGNYSFIFQDCPIPANQPNSGTPANGSAPGFQLGEGSTFGK